MHAAQAPQRSLTPHTLSRVSLLRSNKIRRRPAAHAPPLRAAELRRARRADRAVDLSEVVIIKA
jgi:hypothetical protein